MKTIKVLRGTIASGKHLDEGKTYKVPGDVSVEDAELLVSMKKAEPAEGGPAKAAPKSSSSKDTGVKRATAKE